MNLDDIHPPEGNHLDAPREAVESLLNAVSEMHDVYLANAMVATMTGNATALAQLGHAMFDAIMTGMAASIPGAKAHLVHIRGLEVGDPVPDMMSESGPWAEPGAITEDDLGHLDLNEFLREVEDAANTRPPHPDSI